MDFDDLLGQTVRLLREHPDVLRHYRQRFRHVLVDEYQDTNKVQNELVLLLAGEHHNAFVVGDSDQSIYSFRAADIRNILEFETAFPDTTVVVLDQNYRSTQVILDAANAVIANNLARKPKDLWSERGSGDRIVRYHATDETDEGQWVCRELARMHDGGTVRWDEVAIFYRTNAQSRVVEDQLDASGHPLQGGGWHPLLRQARDQGRPGLRESGGQPVRRGLGQADPERAQAGYRRHHRRQDRQHGPQPRAAPSARPWPGRSSPIWARGPPRPSAGSSSCSRSSKGWLSDGPASLLEAALQRSGYVAELEAESTIDAEGRLENLAELVGVAADFETVDEFLEQVALVADTDDLGDDDSQVTLMTIHSAKGLEYPVVFLVGMEEGVFPHIRSIGEPDQLEEERRLAYVAITRAMERLFVSHAWSRQLFGMTQYNPASRFVAEIPEALVDDQGSPRKSGRLSAMSETRGGAGGYNSAERTAAITAHLNANKAERAEIAIAASRTRGETTSGAEAMGLRTGDDVRHGRFGDGVILSIKGEGDKAEALVRFADAGEKWLLLSWAPLEKV